MASGGRKDHNSIKLAVRKFFKIFGDGIESGMYGPILKLITIKMFMQVLKLLLQDMEWLLHTWNYHPQTKYGGPKKNTFASFFISTGGLVLIVQLHALICGAMKFLTRLLQCLPLPLGLTLEIIGF